MQQTTARITAFDIGGEGKHLVERVSAYLGEPYSSRDTPHLRTERDGLYDEDNTRFTGVDAIDQMARFVLNYSGTGVLVLLEEQGTEEASSTIFPAGKWPALSVVVSPPLTESEDGFGSTLRDW